MGLALTAWRVLRCKPYCAGGYDPVPEDLFKSVQERIEKNRKAPAHTKAKEVVLMAIRNAMVNMPLQQAQNPQFTEMANSSSNIAMSQAMQ